MDEASNSNLEDALDDVQSRFLLNLPESELNASADRLFFQLEQAHWYYEVGRGEEREWEPPRLCMSYFEE